MKKTIPAVMTAIMILLTACTALQEKETEQDINAVIQAKIDSFEKNIHDISMFRTYVLDGEAYHFLDMRKGRFFRSDYFVETPERERLVLLTVLNTGQGDIMLVPDPELNEGLTDPPSAFASGLVFWWEACQGRAEAAGRETVSGRDCYVLDITSAEDLSVTRIWADRRTLAAVKARGQLEDGQPVEFVYSDFHTIAGMFETGFVTTIMMEGKVLAVIRLDAVRVNTGLSDDVFDEEKVRAELEAAWMRQEGGK